MVHQHDKTVNIINNHGPKGAFLIVPYIGAAIYFVQQSNGGFWEVILALLQALVWPAYVVFHVLQALGA